MKVADTLQVRWIPETPEEHAQNGRALWTNAFLDAPRGSRAGRASAIECVRDDPCG